MTTATAARPGSWRFTADTGLTNHAETKKEHTVYTDIAPGGTFPDNAPTHHTGPGAS